MDNVAELASEEAGWAKMGRHLRVRRVARGWFQVTLAERAGVAEATIRSIEKHKLEKRHTPRILANISRALGEPDDYLDNYRKNPPAAEPGDEPEVAITAPPPPQSAPQSAPDLVAPRLNEIVVAALNEIVVPRLNSMEKEVRALADVIFKTSGSKVDVMHPSDPE